MSPLYKPGDRVQSISEPGREGVIIEVCEVHVGIQWYRVFFGPSGTAKMPEPDLREFVAGRKPCENLIYGNIDGYEEFQRLITYQRLIRSHPLRNNIYAFNASRTRFYPYQFKPLFKFLDSPKHRLLVADEVGLGKTIEAGLIMTELRARQTVTRVMVVCPSSLTEKWQLELKRRFGEEFKVLSAKNFFEFLEEFEDYPHETRLNGIVSYETLRAKRVLERFDALAPNFDLVIADEAHWMRNFGTKQRQAGVLLSANSDAMVFLTATPIHLGSENLFSLLNLLDDDEFPDPHTAERRFFYNQPIVKAQICIAQIPPNISGARQLLQSEDVPDRIKQTPEYSETLADLNEIAAPTQDRGFDRQLLLKAQRGVGELNLLGHIFSRTRKREVQTNFPTRRAYPIKMKFTDLERRFYEIVTDYVRAESQERTTSPIIQKWILNTPQRRLASSIPAMVQFYRENFGFDRADVSEDAEMMEETFNDESVQSFDLETARERLKAILQEWPEDGPDTKYDEFLKILNELRKREGRLKVMVFAFFKDTLKYLKRRLEGDGFKSALISGDVHPTERSGLVERFRQNPDIEILLSSKVGSEGLDFQFCDTLFNYDLPWNPMEVEQRIGRLDRIGQMSKVIRIYNFWIEGTIEQRILGRLYARIGIFERSIGELEMILGDELSTLQRDILSRHLTPQEEEELFEIKAYAVERRLQEMNALEQNAAQFIGTDQFFEHEVEMISKRRRYVTGEQLRRFVVDFLKNNCPRSRLEYDKIKNVGRLFSDDKLREFLVKHGAAGEFLKYLSTTRKGVLLTFDAQTAFENPSFDFINVLHPITQAIVSHYTETTRLESNTHYVVLKTALLPSGYYLYFVYRLKVGAAKGGNTIEMVILNEKLEEACNGDDAEEALGLMVEKGNGSKKLSMDMDKNFTNKACGMANDLFLNRVEEIRKRTEKNNNAFVNRRLESLQTSYGKNLSVKNNQLVQAKAKRQDQRYIRMLEGTIRRLETELTYKTSELEKLRDVRVEYDEVSAGILEIIQE